MAILFENAPPSHCCPLPPGAEAGGPVAATLAIVGVAAPRIGGDGTPAFTGMDAHGSGISFEHAQDAT